MIICNYTTSTSYSSASTIPWGNYGSYGNESFYYNTTNTSTINDWELYGKTSNYISKVIRYNDSWVYFDVEQIGQIKSPQDRLREMIQSRQSPAIHCSRKALNPVASIEEMRARDMLRRVIGHDKFRDFMRNGFVSVMAKSGKVYQIFPGQDFTNVFLNSEKIEKLCVVLRGKFPPTDSLIMRYLLILNDEQDFRSYAIQHRVYPSGVVRATLQTEPLKSLPELFRELKVA